MNSDFDLRERLSASQQKSATWWARQPCLQQTVRLNAPDERSWSANSLIADIHD